MNLQRALDRHLDEVLVLCKRMETDHSTQTMLDLKSHMDRRREVFVENEAFWSYRGLHLAPADYIIDIVSEKRKGGRFHTHLRTEARVYDAHDVGQEEVAVEMKIESGNSLRALNRRWVNTFLVLPESGLLGVVYLDHEGRRKKFTAYFEKFDCAFGKGYIQALDTASHLEDATPRVSFARNRRM